MSWSSNFMKTQPGRGPVIYGSDNKAVARKHEQDTQERWDKHAPLIAAAPDLLAALKRMVAENEPAREDSPRREGWEQAKLVIEKAEGRHAE